MKIENGNIIPFYSEYMETDKITSPAFGVMDVCFVYEPETSGDRSSRDLKQVAKKPSNNIHVYKQVAY